MPIVCADARLAAAPRYGRLYIPLGTLVTVWEFLRLNGSRGREQLAFLAGRAVVDGGAQVTCCVLPVTSERSQVPGWSGSRRRADTV